MDFINAFVALANYVIVPGLAYGAQLALGALGCHADLRHLAVLELCPW